MVTCCVPQCKQRTERKDPGVSFHEFPSDPGLFARWLRSIPRENLVVNDRSSSTVVCSKHFNPEDFVPNLRLRRLRPDSVPSIFGVIPLSPRTKQQQRRKEQTSDVTAATIKPEQPTLAADPPHRATTPVPEISTAHASTQASCLQLRKYPQYVRTIVRLRSQVQYYKSKLARLECQAANSKQTGHNLLPNQEHQTARKVVEAALRCRQAEESHILGIAGPDCLPSRLQDGETTNTSK